MDLVQLGRPRPFRVDVQNLTIAAPPPALTIPLAIPITVPRSVQRRVQAWTRKTEDVPVPTTLVHNASLSVLPGEVLAM